LAAATNPTNCTGAVTFALKNRLLSKRQISNKNGVYIPAVFKNAERGFAYAAREPH
jgi:hypothetical protein